MRRRIRIKMSIPLQHRAGDTLKFTESLIAYPASEWTLTYTLLNSTNKYTFVATADADTFSVLIASTVTALWEAGDYAYVAHASKTGERYQVAEGSFSVLPDFSSLASLDVRTHARKVLDAIEAILENRASIEQESYQVAGRSLKRRTLAELEMLRAKYKSELKMDELKSNPKRNRALYVRFKR